MNHAIDSREVNADLYIHSYAYLYSVIKAQECAEF